MLWSALFLAVASVWTPVEQEVARLVGARAARGEGARPVVLAGVRSATAIGLPVLLALAVVAVAGVDELFGGELGVALALVAAVAAFAPNHLTRAALAGTGSFGRYGLCIALDSATRFVAVVVLVLAGVDHPAPYAAAVAVAPLVPVVAFRRRWGSAAAAGPPQGPINRQVLPLVGAQAFAQVLVNGGPVAVALLATRAEEAMAGRFLVALLIARIPLFFFQAVQSSLLPGLARLEAVGDRAGFVDLVRRLATGVTALGIGAVAGCWLLGPEVVGVAFGDEFALGRRDLALLAGSAGAVMVAQVLAQAVIALAGHGRVTAGWAVGVAAAAVTVAVGDDLVLRVEMGLLVGGLVSAFAHLAALRDRLRRWSTTGC